MTIYGPYYPLSIIEIMLIFRSFFNCAEIFIYFEDGSEMNLF